MSRATAAVALLLFIACTPFGSPPDNSGDGGSGIVDDGGTGLSGGVFCNAQKNVQFCDDFERDRVLQGEVWADTVDPNNKGLLSIVTLTGPSNQNRALQATIPPQNGSVHFLRTPTTEVTTEISARFSLTMLKAQDAYVELVTLETRDSSFQLYVVLQKDGEIAVVEEYRSDPAPPVTVSLHTEPSVLDVRAEYRLSFNTTTRVIRILKDGATLKEGKAQYLENLIPQWSLSVGAYYADVESGGRAEYRIDDVTLSWK